MAEDTYTEVPYTGADGKEIVLRSPDGTPRSGLDFARYAQEYDARISTAPGKAYESVNQLLQAGNRAVQSALPGPSLYDGVRTPEQIAATKPQGILDAIKQVAGGVGKTASQFVANQFDTPGEVGTIAGLAAVHPMVRNVRGVLPHIARAGAAAVGNLTGNVITDPKGIRPKHVDEALLTLAASAISETASSLIAKRFGGSLSEKATKQVNDDILGKIRQKYPEISLEGPQAINAYGTTKAGLEDIVKAGARGLRADGDELSKNFVRDINMALPQNMSKATNKELDTLMNRYGKAVDNYLDNLGDDKIEKTFRDIKKEVEAEVTSIVAKEFKLGKLDPARVGILTNTWDKYTTAQNRLESGAKVLSLMRKSGEGAGLDPKRLQQTIHKELASGQTMYRDELMNQVMTAARRGAPPGSTDTTGKLNTGLLPNWISKSYNKVNTPLTRFTGIIRNKMPHGTIDALTNEGIKDFALRSPQANRE